MSAADARAARRGRAGDPELRRAELQLRSPQPPVLRELGQPQLGAGAVAGAAPARRARAGRRRDRLRDRDGARARRAPLRLARAPDDRSSRRSCTRSPRWRCSSCWRRRSALNMFSAEIALVSYTLLILFRNILTGLRAVPGGGARRGARAWACRARQALLRVELPLALPAIIAGLRIAVVTIIALATIVYVDLRPRARRADPHRARRGAVQDRADRRGRPGDRARAARRRAAGAARSELLTPWARARAS